VLPERVDIERPVAVAAVKRPVTQSQIPKLIPVCAMSQRGHKRHQDRKLCWLYTSLTWPSWPVDNLLGVQKNCIRYFGYNRASTCCKLFSRMLSIPSHGRHHKGLYIVVFGRFTAVIYLSICLPIKLSRSYITA
jgi:hypothetical protein